MNKMFAAFASLSACFLIVLMLGAIGAQAQTQGVSGLNVGDRFSYSNTYTVTSTNPSDIVPSTYISQNDSTLQVTVQNVTGSTITLLEVWTYNNGSQIPMVENIDVDTGVTGSVMAYDANLTAGQPLFPSGTNMPAINDSVYRSYENNFRLTNHIELNSTGISNMVYSDMDLYFDQQTGICVEYYLTQVYSDAPNQVITQHFLLTYSSVWQVSSESSSEPTMPPQTGTLAPTATPTSSGSSTSNPGIPTDLIIIIAIVVAAIVVAGFFLLPKGKSKPQPEQPKSAEPQTPAADDEEWPEEAPEKEKSEEDSYSI